MSDNFKTAAELKRLIQGRMDALQSVDDDGEQVFAHAVAWHAPDEDGRNWNMSGYRGPSDYATEIRLIVNALRSTYRLSAEQTRYDGT